MKRTADGARPLLIISTADVSERVNLEARLAAAASAHLGFQRLVTDIASQFVRIEPQKLDATINDSLRQMGEALQLDRAMLWCKPHGEDHRQRDPRLENARARPKSRRPSRWRWLRG